MLAIPAAINSEYPELRADKKSCPLFSPPQPIKSTFPFVNSCITFNLICPAVSPLYAFLNNNFDKHVNIE